MHDRMYGPICGSIHHHGVQNSGGGAAEGGPPTVLEAAEGRPILVDAASYGTIYPIMHGTRS